MVKKYIKITLAISLVLLGILILFLFNFGAEKNEVETKVPSIKECSSNTASWVGLPPLGQLSKETPVIVRGIVEESSDKSVKVRVAEPLKGRTFKKDQIIFLCPGARLSNGQMIIAFINGRYTNKQHILWSTVQASNGIAIRGNDGFQIDTNDTKKVFNLEEIRRVISNSQ